MIIVFDFCVVVLIERLFMFNILGGTGKLPRSLFLTFCTKDEIACRVYLHHAYVWSSQLLAKNFLLSRIAGLLKIVKLVGWCKFC